MQSRPGGGQWALLARETRSWPPIDSSDGFAAHLNLPIAQSTTGGWLDECDRHLISHQLVGDFRLTVHTLNMEESVAQMLLRMFDMLVASFDVTWLPHQSLRGIDVQPPADFADQIARYGTGNRAAHIVSLTPLIRRMQDFFQM